MDNGDPNQIGPLITTFSVLVAVASALFTYLQARHARQQLAEAQSGSKLQGFAALLDWMEPGREDRTVVYKLKTDGKKYAELQQGAPELESVDSVCRSFDVLGYMDRKGLVPMEYVDELYAGALGRVYEDYLAPHIELKRKERGGGHFWELEQLYRRTQNVSEKHPIKTGTEDWPRERRGISQWRPS